MTPRASTRFLLGTLATLLSGCGVQPVATFHADTSSATTNPRTAPLATIPAATRLLDQAAFGPTAADIAHVQQIGLSAYLEEQLAASATLMPAVLGDKTEGGRRQIDGAWFRASVNAPDQLRQRVAFALSEIFVVSSQAVGPHYIPAFHNILVNDAFGNFQTLLKDVTLSPAMGAYLNMLDSAAAPAGEIANENYAREFMQLFNIGLNQLNPDGTAILDPAGNPIPTYTAGQVQAFARAYTGWTSANADGSAPTIFPNPTPNYVSQMVAVDSAHDHEEKELLAGTVLPPGQTAAQDLDAAIANVFAQPNVGPFVCRQLIQHLVMSQPSSAYVARVAAVFNDNGHGVRGDLSAVLRAIFLDYKARARDSNPDTYIDGHLREPILFLANLFRTLGYTETDSNPATLNDATGEYMEAFFQSPYAAPSVFNFFPPDYQIPGDGTNAPEFAIENTATAMNRLTFIDGALHNTNDGVFIDLSATSSLGQLAASSPADLVDTLGVLFMHGQMPANMRQAILDHTTTLSDPAQRARVATYLVVSSTQYKDLH